MPCSDYTTVLKLLVLLHVEGMLIFAITLQSDSNAFSPILQSDSNYFFTLQCCRLHRLKTQARGFPGVSTRKEMIERTHKINILMPLSIYWCTVA